MLKRKVAIVLQLHHKNLVPYILARRFSLSPHPAEKLAQVSNPNTAKAMIAAAKGNFNADPVDPADPADPARQIAFLGNHRSTIARRAANRTDVRWDGRPLRRMTEGTDGRKAPRPKCCVANMQYRLSY
jgi:hypothetical protein